MPNRISTADFTDAIERSQEETFQKLFEDKFSTVIESGIEVARKQTLEITVRAALMMGYQLRIAEEIERVRKND